MNVETETRQKIRAMTEAGLTPREIAAARHVSVQSVYELLRKMDLEPAQRKEEAAS